MQDGFMVMDCDSAYHGTANCERKPYASPQALGPDLRRHGHGVRAAKAKRLLKCSLGSFSTADLKSKAQGTLEDRGGVLACECAPLSVWMMSSWAMWRMVVAGRPPSASTPSSLRPMLARHIRQSRKSTGVAHIDHQSRALRIVSSMARMSAAENAVNHTGVCTYGNNIVRESVRRCI